MIPDARPAAATFPTIAEVAMARQRARHRHLRDRARGRAPLTSLRAFAPNVPAMIVWGVLIVAVVGAGFAAFLVGRVIAVPVIGHATWHAYRGLVRSDA